MIFAVIPWDEKFYNDELFDVSSVTNVNGLAEPYADLKKCMERNGHRIRTIDKYDDLSVVDFFLFFEWVDKWIYLLLKKGYSNRMVYCNAEPPTVRVKNSEEGYKEIAKYFPYIMTWNKSLVDDNTFFYRTIPYKFVEHSDCVPFDKKKLLTSISANKKSDYKDELYTERERLISFFENVIPNDFDMYGVGWDRKKHPSYKGSPQSKFETYNNYKFALALENTRNISGYVTEKIFDCLTGNIVPIYLGADDICDYISEKSFIDYRRFDNPKELLEYITNLDEDDYKDYLKNAKLTIESLQERHMFSGEQYAENIIYMSQRANKQYFKVEFWLRERIYIKIVKSSIRMFIKNIFKRWQRGL